MPQLVTACGLPVARDADGQQRQVFPDVSRMNGFVSNDRFAHLDVQIIGQVEPRSIVRLPGFNPRRLRVLDDKRRHFAPIATILLIALFPIESAADGNLWERPTPKYAQSNRQPVL